MNDKNYVFCPYCTTKLKSILLDKERVQQCSKCGFTHWKKPKPVVSILIAKDNSVLLLQRKHEPFKDYWVLPGGFIGISEAPEEAIKRETEEEIGLIPELGSIVGAYRIDCDPRGIHIDIVYAGKISGDIKLSSEHVSYEFFPKDKLPKDIAYKHRLAILDSKKS